MTTGLEIIKLGWLTQTDWASFGVKVGNIIFVCVALWAMVHFLIIRPKRYKFILTIFDVSGTGIIQYKDRGGWITDNTTRGGEFQLWRDKTARLKMPPREAAVMTKRGKMSFHFLKFGEGPYDYAVLDYTDVLATKTPEVIPLSDLNWASSGVQRALLKKNLGKGFWAENKSTIITLTAIVISMIIVSGAIKMAGEQAQTIASSTSEFVSKFDTIADKLEKVAVSMGGESTPSVPPPPPPPP